MALAAVLLASCSPAGHRDPQPKSSAAVGPTAEHPAELPADPSEPQLTAAEELDSHMKTLRQSGAASRDLIARCRVTFKSWRKEPAVREHRLVLGAPLFRAAGCAIAIGRVDGGEFLFIMDEILKNPRISTWKGAIFRSGPIEESEGKVQATWILFASG
ncbi:MAG TPA: hypothetical protein VFH73_24160 [Polyangia bacterium]|nr:hypothetical protein [Polyangia bacterium]